MGELKPHPEYKDSNLPWLGKIPKHWEEKRAKYYFREVDERSKTGNEELLSVSHITGVTPRSQKNISMFKAESYVGYKLCKPGDLAVNTMWAWMGALGVSKYSGIISSGYAVYRPIHSNDHVPDFIDSLLRIPSYTSEYYCRSTGIRSSRFRLYPENFLKIPVLRPPKEEQYQIVAYLRQENRKIDEYINSKRRLIEFLNEQKQVIISRAVTRGLDPNVRFKPSDIEWLGDVPEHWDILRLRRLLKVQSGDMVLPTDEREIGYPIYGGNGIRGYSLKWNSNGPMVLLGRVGARCGCVHLVEGQFWASEHALRVFPLRQINLKFLAYLLELIDFNQYAIRTAQPLITSTIVREQKVALPPIIEQSKIVEIILQQLKPLDKFVYQTNLELKIIEEYRSRLVSDVVTGKVDIRSEKNADVQVPSSNESVMPLVDDDSFSSEEDD